MRVAYLVCLLFSGGISRQEVGIITTSTTLKSLREEYHRQLQAKVWRYVKKERTVKKQKVEEAIPTNADIGSEISIAIARGMLEQLTATGITAVGQTQGKDFGDITLNFLRDAFACLEHLRPGSWTYSASQASSDIAAFQQYEHLAVLQRFLDTLQHSDSDDAGEKDVRAAFANDYLIKPDIVIARQPVADAAINQHRALLGQTDRLASYTPLRSANNRTAILHASVSCKWTLRSDRAQNARTEALNLIRNRKGHVPHIVVVTGEPWLNRLASLALGTGDIDCVYHMALHELRVAVEQIGDESQQDLLDTLVRGQRLRDISDLPFDLAI